MNLENLHRFERYKEINNKNNKELGWKLYQWSSAFLACFSLIALIDLITKEYQITGEYQITKGHQIIGEYQISGFSLFDVIILIIGIILFCIVVYTNKKVFYKNNENITGLRECIEQYYKYVQDKEKSDNN